MKLLEALWIMRDEKRVKAVRLPTKEVAGVVVAKGMVIQKARFDVPSPLCFTGMQVASDKWEIGWTCERCWGEGSVGIGEGGEMACPGEEGKTCDHGIRWEKEY